MDEGYCIIQMIYNAAGLAVDWRFLQVNRAFEANNGLHDAEGRTIRELAPDIEAKWMAIYDRVARTGQPLRFIEDSQALGRVLNLYAFRIGEPAEFKVAVIFTDITERTRAEAKLRESETRLRVAIDASDLATWEWNLATNEVTWNERHYALFGMNHPAGPTTAADFFSHVHVADRARVEAALQQSIAQRLTFQATFRVVLDDGGVRWMNGYGRVADSDAAGQPLKMSGVMFDVTDRREADAALHESRERLQSIVENTREHAILTLTPERKITSWNVGAELLFDYPRAEVIGRADDFLTEADDDAAGPSGVSAGRAPGVGRYDDERWYVRRDGSRFWGSGVTTLMHDADGAAIGCVKIFRDQTAELRIKEALEESRRQLRQALKQTEAARDEAEVAGMAKDRFLAVLSHELRTPLTPLLLAVQALVREGAMSASAQQTLDIIQRNVRLEKQLVDDLLDVTSIASGKLELQCASTSLRKVIGLAVDVVKADIEAKGQRLDVVLAPGNDEVSGDVKRLQQVFWNLLKNASKFTGEGGEVAVGLRLETGSAVVEVRDSGIGFELEAAERIFAAFEQGGADVTRKFGGLGLGLAIVKATVEAHGGRVRAASAGAGQGATFTVELPLAAA